MPLKVFSGRPSRTVGKLPKVLFANDLWGYGTVTMAMTIADQLEGYTTRIFAGQGPGFDLARRSGFDSLVHTDTMASPVTQRLDSALESSDVVVSVMNEHLARRAAVRGIPCIYVDSLLWMWAEPPLVPPGVRYCNENFPGSAERLEEWRHLLHEPEIIGPLVARETKAPAADPDVALINFGGLSCSLLDDDALLAYAESMAKCALTALEGWTGRVVVTAGRHLLDRVDHESLYAIRPDVELADLSHDAYLAELRRSRLLISSAGTHAIYEACARRVPCVYFPAQNLSQVLTLEVLEREGVVRAFDWKQLYGLRGLDPVDQAGACDRIAQAIHRFAGDREARQRVVRHIRKSIRQADLDALVRRQTKFFDALGELGAPRVAEHVLALLRPPSVASA